MRHQYLPVDATRSSLYYRARPRARSLRARVAAALLIVCALAVIGHAAWLPWVARWLSIEQAPQTADAVVVTYSSAARSGMTMALDLLDRGYVGNVLVSDFEIDIPGIEETHIADLITRHLQQSGVPAERITRLPEPARNERHEALQVVAAFRERGWQRGIVLAKPWRMRRTMLALEAAARGSGIRFIALPIEDRTYQPDRWWRTREGVSNVFNEYLRLAFYVARRWI
jgi:uncharacterized SAM-binding protein YcdF (DUF218 family)